MTMAQDGGKIVSLTHRPPLPPGSAPVTHLLEAESTPGPWYNWMDFMSTKNSNLTVVWLCKIILEDRYNNIRYESGIPYHGTEGVWCENFCKSDNELQTHTSTNKCTILYIVYFPGSLLLYVSLQSSYSGSFHQCCLNVHH